MITKVLNDSIIKCVDFYLTENERCDYMKSFLFFVGVENSI